MEDRDIVNTARSLNLSSDWQGNVYMESFISRMGSHLPLIFPHAGGMTAQTTLEPASDTVLCLS